MAEVMTDFEKKVEEQVKMIMERFPNLSEAEARALALRSLGSGGEAAWGDMDIAALVPEAGALSPSSAPEVATERSAYVSELVGARVDAATGDEYVTSDWIRQQLQNANVDVSNSDIIAALTIANEWLLDEATMMIGMWTSDPKYQVAGLTTPYSLALTESGFTGGEFAPPATPAIRLLNEQGLSTSAVGPKGPVAQPETGWQLYANGVLVDRVSEQVVYKPNSLAPGSPWWYDSISQGANKWSAEEVASWRKRLADLGYLPKEYADTEGFDEIFRSALTDFHRVRYLNNGKAVPLDAAAGGRPNPTLTPKDFATAARNDTRTQFMGVFGNEPTEAELDSWTRFTITQAMKLQRQYMRKGIDESSALSAARSVSAAGTENALWEDPYGVSQRQNELENTSLRDALQRAIAATAGLT